MLVNESGEAVVGGKDTIAAFRDGRELWRAQHKAPDRGILRIAAGVAACGRRLCTFATAGLRRRRSAWRGQGSILPGRSIRSGGQGCERRFGSFDPFGARPAGLHAITYRPGIRLWLAGENTGRRFGAGGHYASQYSRECHPGCFEPARPRRGPMFRKAFWTGLIRHGRLNGCRIISYTASGLPSFAETICIFTPTFQSPSAARA